MLVLMALGADRDAMPFARRLSLTVSARSESGRPEEATADYPQTPHVGYKFIRNKIDTTTTTVLLV